MRIGKIRSGLAFGLVATILGCLTDGPNQTGAFLVENQNLEVTRILNSVTLKNFALDNFWTSDHIAPQPFTPLRTLWVGYQDGFSSAARYGFKITRSPDDLDSLRLRLTQPNITDRDHKRAFNREDTSATPTHLVVRSFVHIASDSAIAATQIYFFQDLEDNSRYLEREGDFEGEVISTLDTIQLDSAGVQKSLAPGFLKNLRNSLKTYGVNNLRASGETMSRDTTFWIFMEVSVKETSSSKNTTKRLSSNVRLEWRKPGEDISSLPLGVFKRRNSGLNVFMSRVRITHPDFQPFDNRPILLTGLSQGLEFSFNRRKVLEAIRNQDANFTHSAFTQDSSQQFDNHYFVPYAEISFPIDSVNVTQSGDYLLQFNARSWIDTVYQSGGTNININLKHNADPISSGLAVRSRIKNSVIDTIYLQYYQEGSRFYFVISFQNQQLDADTIQVDTSRSTLYRHSSRDPLGSLFKIEFLLEPKDAGKSLSATPKTNIIPVKTEALARERYYKPGASKLTTQITSAIQLLLNRNLKASHQSTGFSLYSNFTSGVVVDSSDVNDDFDNLPIPVFSKVPLKLEEGVLKADITIHYYKQ